MTIKRDLFFPNLRRNLCLTMSGGAFLCLFITSLQSLLIAAALFAVILFLSGVPGDVASALKQKVSLSSVLLALVVLVLSAWNFYSSMIYSSKLQSIASLIGISNTLLVSLLTAAISACAFYFLSTIIVSIFLLSQGAVYTESSALRQPLQKTHLLVIMVTAAAVITICSKSSPIYPFNDWVDANCFLTVGKSMLHGKVPYRDLYEQKGPLLYMLHALAALISEKTFLGVYFIEIIACAAFLFFSFRIMRLHCPTVSVTWIPLLAAIVYSATAFCHGDSAEELCLPFFTFALFVGLKAFQSGEAPAFCEGFAIGITSACVLWIKFSMLGFYLGWICVPAIVLLRNGKAAKLFRLLTQIALGVLTASVPILIYFAANHALADLWTVYFYNNLFLYSSMSESTVQVSVIRNLLGGVKNILNFNPIAALLIAAGACFLYSTAKKRELLFYVATFIGAFLLIYVGGRCYTYYSLIFSAFAPVGMALLGSALQQLLMKCGRAKQIRRIHDCFRGAICALSAVLAFVFCNNTYLLSYAKEDMPQYKFAGIIQTVENATLLNYGFLDGGFYTVAGIVPTCRYFCNLNIPLDEIMETQKAVVDAGEVDFVVTRGTELESERYTCVASETFYFEGTDYVYYLYQLVS